jgi:hypothetical protein
MKSKGATVKKIHTTILASYCLSALLSLLCAATSDTLEKLSAQYEASTGIRQRQVARKILNLGPEANAVVAKMLESPDLVIRRNAYRNLRERFGDEALKYYEKALQDPEVMVRSVAVEDLITWKPRSEAVLDLLRKAGEDKDNAVRKLAGDALWDFHRNYTVIRKRPEWDHVIETLQSHPLPLTGWRFRIDPGNSGHLEQWFAPGLDDSQWKDGSIGHWWTEAMTGLLNNYEGVAWYRIELQAPPKPEGDYNEAVLHFESVDECTWVWVNGQFAGEFDIGTAGWNQPFDIEVGSMLNWGGKNQLTVRVLNASGAGGIYKPVQLQILK